MASIWLTVAGLAAAIVGLAFAAFKKLESSMTGNLGKRNTNPKRGTPGDKIVLHSFFVQVGQLAGTLSPFTGKIQAYLRMRGLPYTEAPTDFTSSPNGRLPWLQHGEDVVSDSRFIVRYLLATYPELQKYEPSDPEDAARATLIQRLCEQHLYFTFQYCGAVPEQAKKNAPKFFKGLPYPVPYILAFAWRTGRIRQLRYQGILTNSEEDIHILIDEDSKTLAALLDNKPFFFGDTPTATDACVFGFLEPQLYSGNITYLSKSLMKHHNLVAFVDRIREQYFADKLSKLGQGQGKAQ